MNEGARIKEQGERLEINHCTPEGLCGEPSATCTYYRKSFITSQCVFNYGDGIKCLSPFALMAARGKIVPMPAADKINRCSPKGNCTAETYEQESSCAHYDQGAANGICIKRAWCDVCCSPEAVKAAKAAAAQKAEA